MSILVTGATGNVGRHVVAGLAGAGRRVRAFTRRPGARFPGGVEVAVGDLADPAGFGAALDGVTAVHLIAAQGSGFATVPLEAPEELVALAVEAGVRRVTVLWNGQPGPVEAAVERSGLEWTHLRPGGFMSNDLGWAEAVRSEGVVREPFPEAAHRLVDEADIAAVAVAALTEDGHVGRTYALTGAEALTVPERVAALARASGRAIRYEELSRAAARERMIGAGLDADSADFFLDWHAGSQAEEPAEAADIAAITGRPAGTYARWAKRQAPLFS
ncbi:NAD(P)H-binding protein [Glycomyces sp. NRRL B-16210]|uniref:NmrA family NAD(P)-binding protein n=1 Tax=Glycomyces sp. NRRL B-16210 TaxID=1463821 RepID=UPI0009DEE135|nr:NAD(P)H-binding protein [Glycomyces sp. NRRL B-16210]